MELYLVRHGVAEDAQPGQSDADRALTKKGIDKLRRQAVALERMGVRVDRLFTSPLRRARETADLLAPALDLPVEEARQLGTGCRLEDVRELLLLHDFPERVLLVGHQPDFGMLVEALTGARAAMRKGTMAVIELDELRPGRGVLTGLYDPDLMGHMTG